MAKEKDDQNQEINEMVQVPKEQWEGILADVAKLKKGPIYERPRRVTERIARLRFFKGKPVIWYGNVREIRNEKLGKFIAFMDIKVFGSKELIEVEYIKFLNERNWCEVLIKEQRAEEIIERKGRKRTINPDPVFNRKFQQIEVEDEVVSFEYEADVEVLEGEFKGEVFTVPASCLNA